MSCAAKNDEGNSRAEAKLILNDLNGDLDIWSDNELPISTGDNVSVTCGVSKSKYVTDFDWFKDYVRVESGHGM